MIEQRYLDLLKELSADESAHSGDTLSQHLQETHNLLEKWDNPNDVCVAGLFHSIYGTEYYKIESASLADRKRIADVIGPAAEELAYLFCTTERQGFFGGAVRAKPALTDRASKKSIPVSVKTLSALIEMEVANFVEQFRLVDATVKPAELRELIEFIDYMLVMAGDRHMSKKAREDLAALVIPLRDRCGAASSGAI